MSDTMTGTADASESAEHPSDDTGEHPAEGGDGRLPPDKLATGFRADLTRLGLSEYATKFADGGFTDWLDLGMDEKAARDSLATVITKPGDLNRALNAWREAKKRKEEKDEKDDTPGKPVPLPKLKDGQKLDLTLETVKVENTELKLPTNLPSATTPGSVPAASDLDDWQWIAVAKRLDLTYAIDLERALRSPQGGSLRPRKPAFVWSVRGTTSFASVDDGARTSSELLYSAAASATTTNQMIGASLSFSCPFGSAQAEASHSERLARAQKSSTLWMSASWMLPRARLFIDQCTALHPDFEAAIETALAKPANDRFDALAAVFAEYGTVYAKEVVVGGEMFFVSKKTVTGRVDEESTRSTLAAAVELKIGAYGGGATVNYDQSKVNKSEAQEIKESTNWRVVGGDTTMSTNPQQWSGTVRDPANWRVCGRQALDTLVNRLPKDLGHRVEEVWNTSRKVLWGGLEPPQAPVVPDLGNSPFTISNLATGRVLVQWGNNLRQREKGALGDSNASALWRLEYTGRNTPRDSDAGGLSFPIYRIKAAEPSDVDLRRQPKSPYGLEVLAGIRKGLQPLVGGGLYAGKFVEAFPYAEPRLNAGNPSKSSFDWPSKSSFDWRLIPVYPKPDDTQEALTYVILGNENQILFAGNDVTVVTKAFTGRVIDLLSSVAAGEHAQVAQVAWVCQPTASGASRH